MMKRIYPVSELNRQHQQKSSNSSKLQYIMSLDPPLIKLRIPLNFYLGFNAVMTVSFVPCQNVILSQGFNSNNHTFPFL